MAAIVRPARRSDLPRLEAMIQHVDPGMLTMPSTRAAMEERVERSVQAFERASAPPQNECYFLVLEEGEDLLGTASIFTNLGYERPFYSYRISRDSKLSPEQNVKVDLDLLQLVNDHHGDTELGTLFLEPRARGGGRGKLLSFARLMLIAADPVRFGPKAMAEIRGWTDPDGRSPFWEAVGAKFFQMDYRSADTLSARENRFIADLMPRHPIYTALLPDEARGVIARPHPDAEPALALLKSQGFHYNNVVDIFDAGPCVEAFTDQIDVVRAAMRVSATAFATMDPATSGLVAAADLGRFAVTQAAPGESRADILGRLGARGANPVLVYPMKDSRAKDSQMKDRKQ